MYFDSQGHPSLGLVLFRLVELPMFDHTTRKKLSASAENMRSLTCSFFLGDEFLSPAALMVFCSPP
jgi:hypothetical protein